jgi:hypothetical protein
VIGTIASLISAVSLTFPGSFLEPIWHVNPQAREAFTRLGGWAIALMSSLCAACLCAAIGLWPKRNWGYWLAVGMLGVNMAGSAVNVISATERRAIVGIPIVVFCLATKFGRKSENSFIERHLEIRGVRVINRSRWRHFLGPDGRCARDADGRSCRHSMLALLN